MQNKLVVKKPAVGKLPALKAKPRQVRKVKEGDEPSLANWKPPFPVKK